MSRSRLNKYLPLFEIFAGLALAFLVINIFFTEKKEFENLDLGSETSPYYAHLESIPIHISNSTLQDFQVLKEGWKQRGQKPILLVLGNSQTHAINQLKATDKNYPQILSEKFKAENVDVLAHSIPNANLQELYLIYSFWAAKLPVKQVLLPVFIDDLREDGIREVYAKIFTESGFRIQNNSEAALVINNQLRSFAPVFSPAATPSKHDMKALKETVQEKSETYLDSKLQASFPSWRYRETVRGDLFTFMYKLRNTILRINPQTKRSIIPTLKEKNLAAFKAICQDAEKRRIEVYVYIPPIRYDVDPPYYANEYNEAIGEIQQIVSAYPNARFKKLDRIVAGKYWGTKDPTAFFRGREYDFMHFQYRGHITLADSLYAFIKSGK